MNFREADEKLDEYFDSLELEFEVYFKIIEHKLVHCPPELQVNVLTGILTTALAVFIPIIRDNGYGIEAAGIKKVLSNIIAELDKKKWRR